MRNDPIRKRPLVSRLSQAARLSAICIANGLRGAAHCAHKDDIPRSRLWFSFAKQTIRDLASIVFHEVVPDPYEPKPTRSGCTILFLPGYSMTANGASPLLSYLAGAGFQIVTCAERMRFNNVRRITRWAYDQVAAIRARKQTPILLGYSMGGDIAQRVAGKMGADAVSLSTPIMSQYTFFAALDLILRGRISSRKTFRGAYGTSLSEAFSFHIPRPDQEEHVTLKGVYSHFGVNNPDVIHAVAQRLKTLVGEPRCASDALRPVTCFVVYSDSSRPESVQPIRGGVLPRRDTRRLSRCR
jgi:pimeloyl-ACP methyl ester carboxylesterase